MEDQGKKPNIENAQNEFDPKVVNTVRFLRKQPTGYLIKNRLEGLKGEKESTLSKIETGNLLNYASSSEKSTANTKEGNNLGEEARIKINPNNAGLVASKIPNRISIEMKAKGLSKHQSIKDAKSFALTQKHSTLVRTKS